MFFQINPKNLQKAQFKEYVLPRTTSLHEKLRKIRKYRERLKRLARGRFGIHQVSLKGERVILDHSREHVYIRGHAVGSIHLRHGDDYRDQYGHAMLMIIRLPGI